jgi:predicted nucleic acid-binding protein
MSGITIVFDTCAVIKLLDSHYDMASSAFRVDEARLLTGVIVRMELLSKRYMAEDEERNIRVVQKLKFLNNSIRDFLDDLIVVPLDEAVEQTAVAIRRATSVKLPDCIIAATSIILDAILLTDDDHLLRLSWPGLRSVNIL